MFQHGREAVEIAANWIMGAVAGRDGPLHPGENTGLPEQFRAAAE